jgi:hypothetical protein
MQMSVSTRSLQSTPTSFRGAHGNAGLDGAHRGRQHGRRTAPALVIILIAAAFGPYLPGGTGLRTEQMLIYLAAAAGVLMAPGPRLLNRQTAGLLGLWAALTAWLLTVTAVSVVIGPASPTTSTLAADVDNLVSAGLVALTVATFCLRFPVSPRYLLQIAVWTLLALLATHTLLVFTFLSVEDPGLFPLFWAATAWESGASVGHQALRGGRLIGIFNQPIESGFMYALGLLGGWYLLATARGRMRLGIYGLLVLVFVGGFLGQSKAFTLVGVPLFVILALWRATKTSPGRLIGGLCAMVLLGGALIQVLPQHALDHQARWLTAHQEADPLSIYTAGRRGGEGTGGGNRAMLDRIAQSGVLTGAGLAPEIPAPRDDAYLTYLLLGGVVGLILYLAVLGQAARFAVRRLYRQPSPESVLLLGAVATAALVGFGAPSLTLNRVGTVYWVLQTLCVLALLNEKSVADPSSAAA